MDTIEKKVNLPLTDHRRNALDTIARRHRVPRTAVMLWAIDEYIEKNLPRNSLRGISESIKTTLDHSAPDV